MKSMSLEDFVRKYDLYDRSLDKLEKIKDRILLKFNMFHCDDPQRNETGKEYILSVEFSEADIDIIKGNIIFSGFHISGEILELNMGDNFLKIGINWRDYQKKEENWSEIIISNGPLSLNEEVIQI